MEKVLIATIGNPTYTDSIDKEKREQFVKGYQKTEYHYGEKAYSSCYTFDALNGIFDFDRIILIGTAKSSWHELYEYLFSTANSVRERDASFDEDYLHQLRQMYANKDIYQLPVQDVIDALAGLKNAIRHCAEIIILRPGLNDQEWKQNLSALHHVEKILSDDSKLYIDITCGFRTLPIYEFLSLLYLQNTSGKHIEIGLLTYAMFDKENGSVTRFLDLNPMTDLLEYTRVVHEYNRYGTIHSWESVSDQQDMDSLSRRVKQTVKKLSNVISLNDIKGFKEIVKRCHDIMKQINIDKKSIPIQMRLLAEHIFQDIDQRFSGVIADSFLFQFELALWHFECKRYLVAVTTAEECAISLACELTGASNADYNERQSISRSLSQSWDNDHNIEVKQFKMTFNTIRMLRNELAHPDGKYQDNEKFEYDLRHNLISIRNQYENSFSLSPECEECRKHLAASIHK